MEWISKDMGKKASGFSFKVSGSDRATARANNSARGGRFRRASFRRIEAIDRLTFVHQVQMVPRNGADIFGIRLEQLFLKFEMGEEHAFIFDPCAQLLNSRLGILALLDLGQKRITDRYGRGKNDEGEQETIERMPDALSGMDL